MKKFFLSLALLLCGASAYAQLHSLQGYEYGVHSSPTGKEWESPERLSLNKEQPHAWMFSFASVDEARAVLPQNSSYWKSLDGTWKFHWVGNPNERPVEFFRPAYDVSQWDDITVPSCWNVVGIQKDGSLKYGTPIYANQPVIFQHKVAVGDWKGGVMRTPPKDWTTYKDRNEVGSYRRTFDIPNDWTGRRVYLNFDGVNSFFYLWINGTYVGFSKNSRNTASFDITSYLVKGENSVAVEVYRNSDGSFLEAQDMWRLPGIFRSVYLTSKPDVQLRDLVVIPSLMNGYSDGRLSIKAEVRNLSSKRVKKGYSISYELFKNKLYSQSNSPVELSKPVSSSLNRLEKQSRTVVETTLDLEKPDLWSAEAPHCYTLVAKLKDKKGRVIETVSTLVGFRQVEIKDTEAKNDEFGLAGRYYYINGKPVKLKGVNRQEINPESGNTITTEQMIEEIMLMKRGNINHVRCSHYSNFPQWYYLCDLYGIYLEDEANIESHQYYYGKESLSHVPEFKDAHVGRVMELAAAHVNSPSVVIWSLGNEAGPGENFVHAYKALNSFDPSRPVQYERNNSIVDMGSNQYPSIAWTREAVKGTYKNVKYPFHISEYAHSMGNAGGNLSDYWEAIESTNFFCGAAIWDWVDQALYKTDPKSGTRFFAYGGDFGDKPNSGMFCMNGILFPDHTPKPVFWEVKKVYQNAGITWKDRAKGEIEIFNKRYFTDLSDLYLTYTIVKDGVREKSVRLDMPAIAPRKKAVITLPVSGIELDKYADYYVQVQLHLANDEPWAKKDFVQMEEQLLLQTAEVKGSITTQHSVKPQVKQTPESMTIKGNEFTVVFDKRIGSITSLEYAGKQMLKEGTAITLDAFRAPTDNDIWIYRSWVENGLHDLKHKAVYFGSHIAKDGTVKISTTVESQAEKAFQITGGSSGHYKIEEIKDENKSGTLFKFTSNLVWTIYPDGSIELQANISSNKPTADLPRLGYYIQTPKSLSQYTYYGLGEHNNYADRKAGAYMGQYSSSVEEQFVPFPKPQSMGNREGVKWASLTDKEGVGMLFLSSEKMSVSALPWSALEMTLAPHPYELPESSANHIHLDKAVMGLGGFSCGQGPPLNHDRIKADSHEYALLIRPLNGTNAAELSKVALSDVKPISIVRSTDGEVTLSADVANSSDILYTLSSSKRKSPMVYNAPFEMREGGVVTAYRKQTPWLKSTKSFDRINVIKVSVAEVSSEEPEVGIATNMLDQDTKTIWHSMYSVTVASYPHWISFDAGKETELKGFTLLPRQDDSDNGRIKAYSVQISNDGKKWSDPVITGEFDKSKQMKTVMFKSPVRTRYIRFNALSSHTGADFASAAEITFIE